MPRKRRLFSDSKMYHIIIRGNNKQDLFLDDSDYIFFISRLKKYLMQVEIKLYAYCLMSNHVHLLIGEASKNMITLMKKLEVSYVYYFNTKYERSGHLFQDRYKSEPILTEKQFQNTFRYILQNPMKAGVANNYVYKWNSFHLLKEENSILDKNFILKSFGNFENIINFLSICTDEKFMEYENKPRLSDKKCIVFLQKHHKINNPFSIEKLAINKQRTIIKQLKSIGFSINIISRVTGITKKQIMRM